VFRLAVSLRVVEERAPPLSVQILRTAVEPVCDKERSHTITVYWQASGGTPPIVVGPVSLVYPDGRVQALTDHFPGTGSLTLSVFGMEKGGKVTVRVQANDARGQSKTAEQTVELSACPIALIPIGPIIVRPLQVQLNVRAWRLISVKPGYQELNLPIQVVGEDRPRTTAFTMSMASGTQVTLRAPAQERAPGAPYGIAFKEWRVWVGDATDPTVYPGTFDRTTNTYSLTLKVNANTRVVAVYWDIIG
jgi:hypothetical protein